MTPQTFYAPLTVIRNAWRCPGCIRAIWMTGHAVEGCRCEGCGVTATTREQPSAAQGQKDPSDVA